MRYGYLVAGRLGDAVCLMWCVRVILILCIKKKKNIIYKKISLTHCIIKI